MVEDIPYYLATKDNLLRDLRNAQQAQSLLAEIGPLRIERVLDVGCGIGQALSSLAVDQNAVGVGIDISLAGLNIGREVFAAHLSNSRVAFAQARGESIPFTSESFDVVNCGLAIPYMRNATVLAEVARVLRPGGIFLLKIHHARYYLSQVLKGLAAGDLLSVVHGWRVLIAGAIYHLVGRQPQTRFLNESFQTRWLLRRELARHGLVLERERVKTNPLAPAFVIRKKAAVS